MEVLTISKEESYDQIYKEILDNLTINTDLLDFNSDNKELMKYFINKNDLDKMNYKPNQIPLIKTSKYYSQLSVFEYIRVKYFEVQFDNE